MNVSTKLQTNNAEMDAFSAIENRRSHGAVTNAPVAEAALASILQAACWAPTHKRTEPWRFHVFIEEGRDKLAAAIRESAEENIAQKVYRAPVVIAVVSAPGRGKLNPPVWEDHAATAAAMQNMALATHALGLAGYWRSGSITEMPGVKKLLKVDEAYDDRILGFFYIGHPQPESLPPERPKPDWKCKTTFYK